MATAEGYNGAYTGQQIDAAIGKINDAVTVPGGGTMQMGESLGDGPYTIEVTEDGEGGGLSAEQVGYSNTGSGLEATNVQEAIDELAQKGGGEYLPLTGGTMQGDITIPAEKAIKHGGSAAQIKMMPNGNIRIEAPLAEGAAAITVGTSGINLVNNTTQVLQTSESGVALKANTDMTRHKIANLAAPSDPTDAANKQYVDEQVGASRATKGTYPIAAGQSIQAGDVVDVVGGQVQKTVTPVANEEKVYDKSTGGQSLISCAYLNSEYSVVASKTNGVNSANVNLISNKDGSRITANTVDSPSGQTVASLSIARLSDTQFVVGFASSQNVFLSVGTVSGESINLGSRYTLMALQSGWNCDICIVPFSENQAFVVTCNGSNNYPSGSILSISGSTITKGAWTHPDGVGRPGVMSAARLPDSDGKKRVCVCFNDVNDGNKGKAVIATIDSSNVVTWGSVATIVSSSVAGTSCASIGSVIYAEFSNVIYILEQMTDINSNLTVLGQARYDTKNYNTTYSTLTSFDNFAVGTYFGKDHTDAAVISWDGEKCSIFEPYSFSPVGYANYISIARISNDRMIVAYQSAGSGNYGTTTILTVSGNQIAGSFIDGSQDAIALKSGTAGQSIEVIYSGTVAADWVTEGQVITSPGVYGAGVLAGVLQVWSKDRPVGTKIITGSYIGTGTYGEGNPNSITFDFTPILFWVVKYRVEGTTYFAQEDNESPMIYTPILSENYTKGGGFYNDSAASRSYAKVADNGKTIIWYHADNATKQLNSSGYAYYYLAIG